MKKAAEKKRALQGGQYGRRGEAHDATHARYKGAVRLHWTKSINHGIRRAKMMKREEEQKKKKQSKGNG